MISSEGDQVLAGAFLAIMGKIEAGILQIAKKWSWIPFSERFQLQILVLHQSTRTFKAGL